MKGGCSLERRKTRLMERTVYKSCKKFDFPVHKPIMDLTKEQYKLLWEGNEYDRASMIF